MAAVPVQPSIRIRAVVSCASAYQVDASTVVSVGNGSCSGHAIAITVCKIAIELSILVRSSLQI